jgi:hypothetical protein
MNNVPTYKLREILRSRLFVCDILDCVAGVYVYFSGMENIYNQWTYRRNKRESTSYFDTPEMYIESEEYKIMVSMEANVNCKIFIDNIYLN